ncbi:MAG: MarR family transcriptional regulator, partial [archaeon]
VELSELFPKNLESRSTSIEILNLLEESSGWNQKSLAEQLEISEYKLSRVLKKLEQGHYIMRERAGLDKIIRLADSARS